MISDFYRSKIAQDGLGGLRAGDGASKRPQSDHRGKARAAHGMCEIYPTRKNRNFDICGSISGGIHRLRINVARLSGKCSRLIHNFSRQHA
jgi:hypothetical protein